MGLCLSHSANSALTSRNTHPDGSKDEEQPFSLIAFLHTNTPGALPGDLDEVKPPNHMCDPAPLVKSRKRHAIAGQALRSVSDTIIPCYPKTEMTHAFIRRAMEGNLLFVGLTMGEKSAIISSLTPLSVTQGDVIIEEGTSDDTKFYFVSTGRFMVTRKRRDGDGEEYLGCCESGSGFGELAALYSSPRAATVTAENDGKLWVMEREVYKAIKKASAKKCRYEIRNILEKITMMNNLSMEHKEAVIEALTFEEFEERAVIIKQGEIGDRFYIVYEGSVGVFVNGERVAGLKEGTFFGEKALLENEVRAADVIAETYVTCYTLQRGVFQEVFGLMAHTWVYDSLARVPLLSALSEDQLLELAKTMRSITIQQGQRVFCKGDTGDSFYIVEKGACKICDGDGRELGIRREGESFGERALLNSKPRSATVIAMVDTQLLYCRKHDFNTHLGDLKEIRSAWKFEALKSVPLFNSLCKQDLVSLAGEFERVTVTKGQVICSEGELGSSFYVIESGEVQIFRCIGGKTQEIVRLSTGKYFGERSLLRDEPRAATVRALVDSTLLMLNQKVFWEKMGSIHSVLSRQVSSIDAALSSQKIEAHIRKKDLEILHPLGSGAFGKVYLVRYLGNRRKYAMKCMDKAKIIKCQLIEHIVREKSIMDSLDSKFIVSLSASFQDRRKLYILTRFIEGGEFFEYMTRQSEPFSETDARFYGACVILGLEYLHERGIAWRDLKPENILLDSSGYLMLTDFGFAKTVRMGTKSYTMCGTPEYLAPEVINQKGHDRAVDLWSLGVFLFEMAAGYPPFQQEERVDMFRAITTANYTMPPNFSEGLQDLISNLLMINPSKRLGYRVGGFKELKNHEWFSSLNWDLMQKFALDPPFIPQVRMHEGKGPSWEDVQEAQVLNGTKSVAQPVSRAMDRVFADF